MLHQELHYRVLAPDEAAVNELAEKAVAAGGTLLVAPGQQAWGYVAVVGDPDGHRWQLIEPSG